MSKDDLKKEWERTQLQWDDTEFLEKEANAFMKKRWKRLNTTIAKIICNEDVGHNEFINLLDVGTGRGDFFKYVEGMVKRYVGIEPSEAMLKYEIKEENLELLMGRGEDMDFDNEFDVCLIKEVLDHCYLPETVIFNGYKALKENGIIIISLTNKNAYYKLLFKKKAKQLEVEHEDHLFNFNPKEIVDISESAGFKIEKVMSTNYLRMPYFMENIIGKLPQAFVFWILEITDVFGRIFLNKKGGSFIVVGRKKPN